ncbi:hypothetical protein CEXT_670981 [Caerostris extrusa]|uniref:Uncharacterized protein n=1 Tax=Caerostris extrusa TaxID=172846 RepID=A0AAV4N445_CAEEX|nr:hypothetical protein CEXT_670981 [Caerostris extrusa]
MHGNVLSNKKSPEKPPCRGDLSPPSVHPKHLTRQDVHVEIEARAPPLTRDFSFIVLSDLFLLLCLSF